MDSLVGVREFKSNLWMDDLCFIKRGAFPLYE